MALSNELIMRFVRATKDPATAKNESTVYGTLVESDGRKYVKFDGSDLLTPVESTSDARDGDRVTVMIKNHTATVTGNLTSPSARTTEVQKLDTVVADKVSTNELKVTNANVENLKTNKLDAETAKVTYATIDKLDATNAKVDTLDANKLNADQAAITYATITQLRAMDAKIDNLTVGDIDAVYANIDFSNIGKAAMEYFYAQSGLIKNVVVGDQTITGELVGVTISGDRLIGNTVIAEKLVIKGSDGLYYKLNTDGMKVEAQQTDQNSLNGQIIKAKSITATKISVDDLVAFDATIGGFKIGANSIYSGVKSSVGNTTRGIYLDNDGQVAFGDSSNFLKYYKDANGKYKLAISVDSLSIRSGADIGTAIENLQNGIDNIEIGGRNMVENSDFSSGTTGPWRDWGDAVSGTRAMVTVSTHPQFTTGITAEKTSSGQWGYAQDNIPVTKGCKYVLSAWFKVQSGNSDVTIICQQGNSTDRWTSDEISTATVGTTNWYRLCHKFTAASTSTNVYIGMQGSGSGKVTFTGVQLEKGDAMSDWTPYLENVRVGGTNLLRGTKTFDSAYWINNGGIVLSETIEGGALYSISTSWSERAYSKLADIEIDLNTDYTLSWYAKASSDAYLPMMHFYCTNGTTPIVNRYGSSYQKAVTKEWRRYSHTFRFTSMPTSNTQLRVEPSTTSTDPANAYLIIGAFKLERGNRATDWAPAPEDVASDISNAGKTATNFLAYDSTNGLQLGNKTGGAWSGFRTQITSSAFNILNSAGATLASYGEKLIELGKNATDAVIKLCGGKGQIEYTFDSDTGLNYLQMSANKLRLKSSELSSLYSLYSDNSTRWEKSATNVYPDAVNMYASKCIDPTMVEKVEGWRTSGMDIKPTYIDAYSPGDILIRSERNLTICDAHGSVYSVQTGTSGIWTYKKWSNGEVELWGAYSVSNIDCTTAIGNMYRTAVFSPSSFPFTVYNPNLVASYESTGYGAFLWATTSTTNTAPPNYYLIRPTSATIASGKINFHVRGKWKT